MKTYNSIIRCITAAALVLCCAACADEWDAHYDANPGVNGSATQTLWEQIQSRSELKNFATVCEATPFRTSETNKPKGYNFAHLLGKPMGDGTPSNVVLTLFAPVITDAQRDSLLNMIKEGKEWEVQTQFLANHIRRNRLDIVGKQNTDMYMLNSKLYSVNCADSTFNGVKITNANVQATNGVMHVLRQQVSFRPNLHEYLRALAPQNDFAKFIVLGDSSYFVPSASIEGEPDEYGRITYIDSVFHTTNKYFSFKYSLEGSDFSDIYFDALTLDLAQEDSMFAMVIPSTEAFNAAIEKYKKYFRYADYYENNTTRNAITSAKGAGYNEVTRALPGVKDVDNMQKYLDSLQLMQARSAILRMLTYNMHLQYRGPQGDQNAIIDAFDRWAKNSYVDSVGYLTARNDTVRQLPYRPYYRTTQSDAEGNVYGIDWDVLGSQWSDGVSYEPKSLLGSHTPVRMSNGLAYNVDALNLEPFLHLHQDIIVEAENDANKYQANIKNAAIQKAVAVHAPHDTIMRERGYISNQYLSLEATGTGAKNFTLRLPAVVSGKYDIYVVTVPEYYNSGNFRQCSFQATLSYRGNEEITAENKGNYSTIMSDKILTDSSKVHTYLLFKDFEFPYSYIGLNYSYPTLTFAIDSYSQKTEPHKTNNLCIDMIYLKAKKD